MSFMINSRHVGSNRGNLSLVLSFVLAAAWFLSASLAFAVPLATTQVAKQCEVQAGGGYDEDRYDSGLQPYEQATASSLSVVGAGAEGYASAGFGPGIPQIGITSTSAQIYGYNGTAEANFAATVMYYFEIQPIGADPGISLLPVLFSARGEGYAEAGENSLAWTQGVADLYGPPLSTGEAKFVFDSKWVENKKVEYNFSGTMHLSLYPNYNYGVVMTAACATWGLSASCTAEVDPFIGFDQATFDAIMGENTFPLNKYYRLVYSENVPNVIYVSRDGLCADNSPCYSTIQNAIASVSAPSIIKITQETYNEDILLNFNQVIVLEGGWDTSFTSCSSSTIINGSMTIIDGTMVLGGAGSIILE